MLEAHGPPPVPLHSPAAWCAVALGALAWAFLLAALLGYARDAVRRFRDAAREERPDAE